MAGVVALVGRPNVGKSTLFNRMTRSRDALVADLPGLTRDRQYGVVGEDEGSFILIDTGGLSGADAGIDESMARQTLQAVEEADLVLLLVDARAGLTPGDELIAERLRRMGREAVLVANKVDGVDIDVVAEFAALGCARSHAISASHGRGVRQLLASVIEALPEDEASSADPAERGVVVGVVGRPNVGKSTLVNRLLGEERVVVCDEAGTTRDAIYVPYDRDGRRYTLVDTAGVRRRGRVSDKVEKFSIVKTLDAIQRADVVVAVVDAAEGLVEQDLHLLGTVLEAGRAAVLAVNKWDGLDRDQKQTVRATLERRLNFAPWIRIHFISALHGSGVGKLYPSIDEAHRAATTKLSTSRLTAVLEEAVRAHEPPLRHGRRIKMRYAHAGGLRPPRIIVHGNQVEHVNATYQRYLENRFRERLDLKGTPIRLEFKGGANPYEGRKNTLTPRQLNKRKRLMQHVKKKRRRG